MCYDMHDDAAGDCNKNNGITKHTTVMRLKRYKNKTTL